jgi:hypothetical protein
VTCDYSRSSQSYTNNLMQSNLSLLRGVSASNLPTYYHPIAVLCVRTSFVMFSFTTFSRVFSQNPFTRDKAFIKKESTTTIRKQNRYTLFQRIIRNKLSNTGTSSSTKIERKINYIFADGVEVSSEVSSKTTFSTRRMGRHGPSYSIGGMATLVEAAASAMAEAAVEEVEGEIVDW